MQLTRLFAEQKGVDFPFCVEELAFIAKNIAMGLIRLPQIRDNWKRSETLKTLWFPSILPPDRFLLIHHYLHLNDSSKQKKYDEEGYDSLYKVSPLLDHLMVVFQLITNLSIDEMMIGTCCCVVFLQKPTKSGIKVWVNSEAMSGYVLNLQVYTGAAIDCEKKVFLTQ